jgi:hypothetical protein
MPSNASRHKESQLNLPSAKLKPCCLQERQHKQQQSGPQMMQTGHKKETSKHNAVELGLLLPT